MPRATLFVFGDQLSAEVATFARDRSANLRVLMIDAHHLRQASRHPLRRALYGLAMRAYADDLREAQVEVDFRSASSFSEGLREHVEEFLPERVLVHQPRGRRAERWCRDSGLEILPDPFFLTDPDWFSDIVARYPRVTLETFYRHQRRRLNFLMEGNEPSGGRWNFDQESRQPLPRDGGAWPEPWRQPLDDDERRWLAEEGLGHLAPALEYWPRTREHALRQLDDALERIVPFFGPYEDAASSSNWHLAHSRLSVALNLGLLHPREVAEGVEAHYRAGRLPLASAEGFMRQVIGWREWVAAWHRRRPASYRRSNALGATRALPASWRQLDEHPMACLNAVFAHVREFGWAHHIERLMVLTNAATLAGYDPASVNDWMAHSFLDGAEWVMEANVIGMGLFADGGATATKPYVAGGNYLSTMTDFCRGCAYSPKERTGSRACPLTTLYWQFFVDQAEVLASVHRVAPVRRAALARNDLPEIAARAPEARRLVAGETTDGLSSISNVAG